MLRLVVVIAIISFVAAFVPPQVSERVSTRAFVQPSVDFETSQSEFKKKNSKYLDPVFPEGFEAENIEDFVDFAEEELEEINRGHITQYARDRRLATTNAARYCADRCLSTGNCDVFEDMLQMTAEQVREFCSECVMSSDEEACDVPDALLKD